MIEEILQKDLVEAMKSHNEVAVNAIRSVKSAIQVEKTNGSFHDLSDNDIVKIIQKQVKQRLESEQIYLQASTPRYDLAENEHLESEFLEKYLPKMMDEETLKSVIDQIIAENEATTMKDMGKVMKALSSKYPNQYDGKAAGTYIKEKLS